MHFVGLGRNCETSFNPRELCCALRKNSTKELTSFCIAANSSAKVGMFIDWPLSISFNLSCIVNYDLKDSINYFMILGFASTEDSTGESNDSTRGQL